MWLYLAHRTDVLRHHRAILHYSPEPALMGPLRAIETASCTSIDLESPLADRLMDATDLQFPDQSFDLLLCSHTLEHISDDRRAMREMFRVLRPAGRALLQHPIVLEQRTFEDPSVTDPSERLRLFSQEDHVRVYGPDIRERLVEAGFYVSIVRPDELVSPAKFRRYGLAEDGFGGKLRASDIHVCTRPDLRPSVGRRPSERLDDRAPTIRQAARVRARSR